MKQRNRCLIILTTIITFIAGAPSISFAAAGEKSSTPTASSPLKEKSKPFSSPSALQPKNTISKKRTVYCCVKGRVVKKVVSETETRSPSTSCSTSISKTESFCGVCCINGKTTGISSEREKTLCTRKGGRFYKRAADCKADDIYCCLKGVVKKVSPEVCREKKGKAFNTERSAKTDCGWCCAKSIVFPSTSSECNDKRGKFYSTKKKAERACVPPTLCCIKGKLTSYTQLECKQRGGIFYSSLLLAKNKCRSPIPTTRQSFQKTDKKALSPGVIGSIRPVRLPDLAVMRTFLNSKCYMKVTIKNIGGPIQASEHAAAKIHLSAGPGLISSKTTLIGIDPLAKLRTAGGSITYTTKLRITKPNQATLVWIDTDHHIVESNEINNGDDALLTCRTLPPLVWCCTDGRVEQISRDDCKRLDGSVHKTETAAEAACGTIPGLRPRATEAALKPKGKAPGLAPKKEIRGTIPGAAINGKIPDMIPMIYDMGIRISLPGSATRLYQGETFTVRYQFSREAAAGDVSFTAVHRGTAIGAVSATVYYNPLRDGFETRELTLTLPEDVAVGEYFILATHSASGAHGESDPFRVEINSARISLHQPEGGEIFLPGGSMDVSYQFDKRVAPGIISFSLYTIDSGTPLATMTRRHTPVSADRPLEKTWSLDFPIPMGISSDHCFIVASHPHAMGTSNTFAIRPMTFSVPGPADLALVDIIREADGQVKARVRSRNFSGAVELQVNGRSSLITATVEGEETDVVIDDMPAPVMGLGLDSYLGGVSYEVTIDPLNTIAETNESNNSLTRTLHYWEQYGEVFLYKGGERIPSGGTVRIPCGLTSYERGTIFMLFVIKNYGSETVRSADTLIEVTQTGRRPRGGGALGDEEFSDVLSVPFYVSDCSLGERRGASDVPSGQCGFVRIGLDDITGVDSGLRFRTSGAVARWPLTVNPYTVHINFGEYAPFSGECEY